MTARELLDRGAERIEKDLVGQPSVRVRLLQTMGQAYTALGLPEQAIPLFERALESSAGEDLHARVVLMSWLAWAHRTAGHAETALDVALRAVETARSGDIAVRDDADAVALQSYGTMLRERGEYPRARAALQEAVEIRERMFGRDHLKLGLPLYHLGWTLHLMGDDDAARRIYERACAIFERGHGLDHALTAWCHNDHGLVLVASGDHVEGERLLLLALDIRRRILPSGHPDLTGSASNLANLHLAAGDLDRSRNLFDELVETNRARYGNDHPEVAVALAGVLPPPARGERRRRGSRTAGDAAIGRFFRTRLEPLRDVRISSRPRVVATGGSPRRRPRAPGSMSLDSGARGSPRSGGDRPRPRPPGTSVDPDGTYGRGLLRSAVRPPCARRVAVRAR